MSGSFYIKNSNYLLMHYEELKNFTGSYLQQNSEV